MTTTREEEDCIATKISRPTDVKRKRSESEEYTLVCGSNGYSVAKLTSQDSPQLQTEVCSFGWYLVGHRGRWVCC